MSTETVTFICEMCSTVENCADRFIFSGMDICIECYSQDEEPVSACHKHYLAGIYDCDVCRITDPISECLSFIIDRIQDEETNAIKEEECPICMEQMTEPIPFKSLTDELLLTTKVPSTNCSHFHCVRCFLTLVNTSNKCSICRSILDNTIVDEDDDLVINCICCGRPDDECDCVVCPCGNTIIADSQCGECNRTHCRNCNVFNQYGCRECFEECEICFNWDETVCLRELSNQNWCGICAPEQIPCEKCGCWMWREGERQVSGICDDCEAAEDEDA
jgi:hypothetical protein